MKPCGRTEPGPESLDLWIQNPVCRSNSALLPTENAIQSFGYGSEGGPLLVTEPLSTFPPAAQPPIISRPAPSLHGNAIKPMDGACVFSTCANLQVSSASLLFCHQTGF